VNGKRVNVSLTSPLESSPILLTGWVRATRQAVLPGVVLRVAGAGECAPQVAGAADRDHDQPEHEILDRKRLRQPEQLDREGAADSRRRRRSKSSPNTADALARSAPP
jgi:hypothetical protein